MLSLPRYMTAYMPRSNKNEGDNNLLYCKTFLWMIDLFVGIIVNNKRFAAEIQGRGHRNEIAQVIQTHALENNLKGTYCLQAPFPRSTWTSNAENLRQSVKNLLQKVDPMHFVLQICSDRISKFQRLIEELIFALILNNSLIRIPLQQSYSVVDQFLPQSESIDRNFHV